MVSLASLNGFWLMQKGGSRRWSSKVPPSTVWIPVCHRLSHLGESFRLQASTSLSIKWGWQPHLPHWDVLRIKYRDDCPMLSLVPSTSALSIRQWWSLLNCPDSGLPLLGCEPLQGRFHGFIFKYSLNYFLIVIVVNRVTVSCLETWLLPLVVTNTW